MEWILKVGLGREVQSIYLDGHLNPRPEQVKVCMAMTALKQCVNKYQEGNAKTTFLEERSAYLGVQIGIL